MSRQNKARHKAVLAEAYTKQRKEGKHGPSSTTPAHGKDRSRRWRAVKAAQLLEAARKAEAALAAQESKANGKQAKNKSKAPGKNLSDSVGESKRGHNNKAWKNSANTQRTTAERV